MENPVSHVNSDHPKGLFSRFCPRENILIVLIVSAVTFFSLHQLYIGAFELLNTPYDLLIQSHNLATVKVIQSGEPIYDESFYGDVASIITIYNPLFY
jgi:hypothetical protein